MEENASCCHYTRTLDFRVAARQAVDTLQIAQRLPRMLRLSNHRKENRRSLFYPHRIHPGECSKVRLDNSTRHLHPRTNLLCCQGRRFLRKERHHLLLPSVLQQECLTYKCKARKIKCTLQSYLSSCVYWQSHNLYISCGSKGVYAVPNKRNSCDG